MKKRTIFFALFAFLLSGSFLFGMDSRLDEKKIDEEKVNKEKVVSEEKAKNTVKLLGGGILVVFEYVNDAKDIANLALVGPDFYLFFVKSTKNRPFAYNVPFSMVEGQDEPIYNSFHNIGASAKKIIEKRLFKDVGDFCVSFDIDAIYLPNEKLAEVFDEKNNITKCLKDVNLVVDSGQELLLDRLKGCRLLESIFLDGGTDPEYFPDLEVCYVCKLTEAIQDFSELRSLGLWFNSYNFDEACECERITELSLYHVCNIGDLSKFLGLFPNLKKLDVGFNIDSSDILTSQIKHKKVLDLRVSFYYLDAPMQTHSREMQVIVNWFPNLQKLNVNGVSIGSEFIAHKSL